jgi:dTDP-glucose 4,6-dehydratase
VLVTGAGGFIGSHLVEELVRSGAKVRAIVRYNGRGDEGHLSTISPELRREVDVQAGDVADRGRTREAVDGCEVVFHLAALIAIPYSYRATESYLQSNIQGTFHVLEACRECKVSRMVHTSTSEVYGTAQYTPIDERHPLNAQSPYAASKVGADQLALSYRASFETPVVIVRPFNNFGPRQSARAVIPTIISQAVAGDTVRLGATSPVRDFLFVKDSVRGFMAAAAGPDNVCGEVFNLGTGVGVTIGEVVERVAKLLNKKLHVQTDEARQRPAGSEVHKLLCSAKRAEERLGWRATTSLDDGLDATIDWIRTHTELYKPSQYTI